MYAMKTFKRILLAGLAAIVATSCTSAFYSSSGSAYDDLYAIHDRTAIANRQKAEAEARRAEYEARQAQAQARQAELEAQLAELGLAQAQAGTRTDSDGVIIVDDNATRSTNVYDSYIADDYESAYARRLLGFKSATYRKPSSYFNLRYGGDYMYVTAYDPAIYNVLVSGDQVWVEPRYITSMFGTWGATNATMLVHSPWYYGWHSGFYDPWYYSSWGFPRYSWYDWNWNICYGSHWGLNLWWGWGGYYRPWRPYHHHHFGGHHFGGPHFWGHHYLGGGGGYWNRGGSYYGSRGNAPRDNFGVGPRTRSLVNRGSAHSTPYRSPNTGKVYGESSRGGGGVNFNAPAQGSAGRSQGIGRNNNTSRSRSYTSGTTQQRPSSGNVTRNNSSSRSNYSSGSTSRGSSSSFSSGSSGGSRGGGGGFSGGSSGGGGSRGGGSRGR